MRAQRRMLPFPFLIALLWFTRVATTTATTMGKSNQRNYNSVKSALIKGNNNNNRERERERGGNNKRELYNNIKITLCTIKANEQCKGNLKWGLQTQTKRKAFHWVFDMILKLPFASVESIILRLISFEVGTNWSIQMQLCDPFGISFPLSVFMLNVNSAL